MYCHWCILRYIFVYLFGHIFIQNKLQSPSIFRSGSKRHQKNKFLIQNPLSTCPPCPPCPLFTPKQIGGQGGHPGHPHFISFFVRNLPGINMTNWEIYIDNRVVDWVKIKSFSKQPVHPVHLVHFPAKNSARWTGGQGGHPTFNKFFFLWPPWIQTRLARQYIFKGSYCESQGFCYDGADW